jgi:hypothetical protein
MWTKRYVPYMLVVVGNIPFKCLHHGHILRRRVLLYQGQYFTMFKIKWKTYLSLPFCLVLAGRPVFFASDLRADCCENSLAFRSYQVKEGLEKREDKKGRSLKYLEAGKQAPPCTSAAPPRKCCPSGTTSKLATR